ncbi:hypothetical protein B0A55_06008 [Friedmanniomyces simplex]|uniref:SprT-like domain-containing protein n=1 Tax=Friedmanniomyces simplex TaxID=329884 RepID=A0A4V6WL53_9PEZI|nr:hypothetical protein B0A55_06008 [Friedmanniomyces simplex]
MHDLLPILSNIFFLGKLYRVDVTWRKDLSPCDGCYGYTITDGKDKGVVYVILDPDNFSQETGTRTHRGHAIGTMLHECVHAFLMLYCGWDDCAGCRAAEGENGHGRAWVRLAMEVEAVAWGMLRADVRLGAFDLRAIEYTPCADDWERYYDEGRVYGAVGCSWPFKPDSEQSLDVLMGRSMELDERTRSVLYRAAVRHGEDIVASQLVREQEKGGC